MTSTERDAYVVVSQDMASLYNLKVPASEADVGDLYWIMKDAFGVKLMKDVDLSAFEVYSNMTTFEADNPLGKSDEIDGLGLDHTDPMVVKLPWSHSAPKETVPKPKQTINKPRWKKVEETVPTLEDDCLSFVNRDAAVKALCKVHLRVFNGACKGPRGGKWPIALADNELGLGKNSVRTKLHPPLSRTVAIGYRQRKFSQAAMSCGEGDSVEDALEMTVNEAIAEAVAEQLDFPEGAMKPNYLSHPYKDLVKSLAKDLGPVFIMLDEIGHGFVFEEPGREEISHEIFFIFCVGTLSKWMETKDVYFVLMDYAPFLRNVGERKDHSEYSTSSFAFSRLSLQLIRPEKIQLIMRQTWTNNEMTETLAARWGLSTEAEIAKAAEVMYEKTCGHPRKMFHMFDTCATFDDLVVADADDIGDEQEWENVYRQLRLWQPLLEKWLPQILEKKPMDLTKAKNCLSPSLPHDQQRNISYAVIMERCHLGREGTLDEAIVYALPRIMAMILGIVQPFREYVRFIETYRKVTLDHAGVWEWVCIKRFQELFAKHCKPGEKLPKFFGADTVFGNLPDVQFPGDFIDLPKITSAGQQNSVSLSSLTAHPTKWSALMCEIHSRLQVVKSLCIKPLGQSASPDVILMKRIERFTPGGKRLRMATLTVALAMKNYKSTGFSETQLKHECKIFDQMFKILGAMVANPTELAKSAVKPIQRAKPAATAKSEAKTTKQAKPAGASNAKWTKRKLHQNEGMRFDEETKESCIGEQRVELQESDERINVLIVCATNYCAGYAKAFGGKLYSVLEPPFDQTKNTAQYPNITEIILLDLTTHESRAEFFGLEDDEVLGQALDRLIKKVVPEKLSNSISAS